MHSSILIAGLIAASAYATPLRARSASALPAPASNQTVPTAAAVASTQVLGVPTAQPNPATPSGFVSKLLVEDTTVNRFKDIEAALDAGSISLIFDFNPAANPGVKAGLGGQVDLANRANFPVLTDQGLAAGGLFFQPCGLNTPHIHPRSPEFFTLVTDTRMRTGFVLENGLNTEFHANLTQYQGTVFPQGSIHWQQNLDCKPAVGIAGFNSEDPGASVIAQNFFQVSPDVIDATLGFPQEINADNFRQFRSQIPAPFAKGIEECLTRCNIAW